MADEKFGRHYPITSEPVLTAEEIAKRNLARSLQKQRDEEELKRRQERLRADALQQAKDKANPDEQDRRRPAPLQRREDGEWRRESTAPEKPTTVTRDNVAVPLDQAIAEIPEQMATEQRILSSSLRDRALRRARVEELMEWGKGGAPKLGLGPMMFGSNIKGMTREEAEAIAIKEQQGRKAAFESGRKSVDQFDSNSDKELSAFTTSAGASVVGPVADILGFPQYAQETQAAAAGAQAAMAEHRGETYAHPELAGDVAAVANTAVQMVPGAAAGLVAGPNVGLGVMAAQYGAQTYSEAAYEAAEAGLAGDGQDRYAKTQTAITMAVMPIFNMIPGMAGLEGRVLGMNLGRRVMGHPSIRRALMDGAKTVTKDLAAEVAEEVTDSLLGGVAKDKLLNQPVDYKQILTDTIRQTVMTWGTVTGAQKIASRMTPGDRMTPDPSAPEAGTVTPSTPTEDPATPAAEGTPVTSPEPVPNHPAIEAFLKDPSSARKYESAVKAGLPSIEKPNRDNRAKYADDLRKQRQADPVPQPAAPLEPAVPMEAPSGTVPDGMQEWMNALEGGNSNGQENDVQGQQEQQGQQEGHQGAPINEGRQESLLTPAGTQVLAPPADSQSPAAHTRESFESEYRNNADQMMALPPDDPAREAIRERQSALYEAHPDWADEIHNNPTPSPVVGPGEAGPDQSSVPATGPVSSEPAENQTSPVSSEPDAIQYHSGLSRSPADMDSSIQSGNPVGVSAFSSLSQPVRKRLVDYANNDGKVFVDSGAFTAHRKGKEVDWDRTLFSYHELLSSVAPDKRENVSIVAPDVVGDHDETMRLQWFLRDKFNSIIELGGKVILPVQKDKDKSGGGSLFANWADATDTFSGEQNEKFIIGVPFNEEAWSQDDVLNFMKERQKDVYRGSGLRPFHLLGAGPSKVQALFEAAQAEGLSLDGISADAMPKKISQRKRPAKPKEESPQTPADSPVPAFAALPQKSQDLFNKAFESKDVEQLKQMVDKSNVAWNKEFERRTGVKLPRTLKDRYRAVMEWANPTPTYGKRSGIPKWGIYQTMFQGKPKFSVKESDKGFGDSLHDTAEEAKKYADIGRQRETERAEAAAKRQAAEEADQKKQQDHEASFQGFLTDDPMVKGRRLKTLDSSLNYKNKTTTRKALVEQKVADGWTVNDKDQLQAQTGEFLDERDLTKTGIDYARHLIDLKPVATETPEPAKAETPPAESQPEQKKPSAKPDDADPIVVTKELTDKEIAKDGKGGVKPERKIVVVDKQGRTLAITKSARFGDWSVSEREGRVDKWWASGIPTLEKAKDIARRVYRDQFTQDADLVYGKRPAKNLGMTNSEFGKDIANQKNSEKLAGTLIRYGLASNGAVMVRVSEKDKAAILKGIGEDVIPSVVGYPAAQDMMDEMQRSLPDLPDAEILGFRGGDYHDATVAIRDAKSKDITVFGQKYVDTARKKFPNATLKMAKDKLILVEGDTVVGMVVARLEPGDYHHDMLKKQGDAYPWKFDPEMEKQESPQPEKPAAPEFQFGDAVARSDDPTYIGRFEGKGSDTTSLVRSRGRRTHWNNDTIVRSDATVDGQGYVVTPPDDSPEELNDVEQATLDELMGLLAPNQTPAKPEKKPRSPKAAAGSQPAAEKKPRSKVGEKIAKAKAASDADVKASYAKFLEDMRDQKIIALFPGAPPVMNPKAIASAVRLTADLAKNGVLTFADFATLTVENIGAELATKLAPYLETAWTMLKRVPGYDNVDAAGSIADYIQQSSETPAETISESPALVLVESLRDELLKSRGIDAKQLWTLADQAYGGTRAEGKYGPSEAYDALETAINLTILDARAMGLKTPAGQVSPEDALKNLLLMQSQIVSQTNRSGTKDTMQQFSTPPAYSYVVSQFVNMDARDVVLEPSAGTGDLAIHALNQRAKVHVNELDPKRAEMLRAVQEAADDRLTISTEDALQLGNIMGPNLRPSVVLMNPPFSREGQRMGDKKMSGNDRNHIDAAMGSLIDGGRLVAIIGAGLHGPSKGFTTWLAETAKKHNVRANIEVSRDVYKGYGTTFPTRVLVIDKGTPTPKDGTLTAQADSLEHLLTMTKGIRNDRNRGQIQPVAPGQNVPINAGENEGGQQSKVPDRTATAASDSGQPNGNASKRPAKAPKPASGTGGNIVADDTRGRADNADSQGTRSKPSGSSKPISTATTDATGEPTGNLAGQSPEPRRVAEKRTEIDESVLFEPYQPSIVPFPNAKPHPTAAVESAAMAAVEYPEVTEVPNIDASIIDDGRLSDVQLEFVALAAHAHNQILPNEERTGILFGDGTGMGKGRGIPGVILHNWNEGRRKAIWMSKNGKLHSDAMREWEELGGNPAQVANLSDMPVDNAIDLDEGILFATYDTLKSSGKSGKTRESQVTDWLPADFDGVIAFDEAHLMGSDTAARAGVARQIQDKFPKARIVYASATAATEIDQLMFGSRLGLWGAATPFATAKEFAAKIGAAGVSAMESVALSLKAMGRYVSRSISFNDGTPDGTVGYKRLNHTLADHQVQMYDRLADAWQKVIGEFEDAMDATKADNQARGFARGQFWSAHQRFFNDLVTSLQMPTVIESIEKDLAEGRSVVIQLTTTGAAQQARALAGRGTQSLDDFAVDPFSSLVELVRSQFPTQAYENYMKDDGSIGKRRVVDSEGKPVKDAAAVAKQQQLLSDLADMEQSMPDSPIDMILNYFGTENVAEVTGRNQRVVWQEQQDGTKKRVLEKRSQKKSNQADIDAFQEGKKRILIFSQAGGTGASYHADRRARNQEKRMHYLVQPGWVAADAIQGLGRTHRTNQKQAPEYILVQTDIPGQKRFISTIARRLTQLGALTRGQRTAGGSGVFDASDNLESTEAALALTEFFKSLEKEDAVMSLDEFEAQTGLELRLPSTGAMKADGNLPDITSFMNRMLSMQVASQNKVFDEFDRMLKTITEARRLSGELDQGVETIKGSNIRKTRDEVVFTHDSGAKTRYVQLTMEVPIPSKDFDTQSKAEKYKDFIGYYKRKSDGKVFFVNESFSKTSKSGQVVEMIRLVPPYGEALREEAYKLNQGTLEKIQPADAEQLWNEQFSNRPKTKSQKVDMITGAVLPVWDRLPQLQPKLSRALTTSGDMVLGVVLPPSKVNETLGKLGAEKNKVDVGETVKMLRTGKGDVQLVNGWKIQRVRVQNEWRLEIVGPTHVSEVVFQRQGVITERIGFKARYFIPFGENTQTVFDAVTRGNPVQKVNQYDSATDGDNEEDDVVAESDAAAATQPTEAGSTETEAQRLRREADQAQQELQQLRDSNARNYDVLGKEWDAIKKGERQGSSLGLPVITKEASFAIAGLALNSIKIGVKSFEVFVRELRANMAEDMVKGVKPNIIAAWNALRGKYGLDEATETAFDAVIAETGDVDLQQAAEAAAAASTPTPETETPPTGATPDPEPLEPDMEDGPDRLYSTQNAATDAERERLGVAPRQPKERQRNEPLVNLAAAMGKTVQGAKDTDALIAELTVKPRATTPLENHQLNFRYAMLDQKYAAALEERNAARRIGDDVSEAIAERESELYLKEQTDLLELLSGGVSYFLGAGLQARKTLIQRDFSMARSLLEFEAAYGREPNGYERSAMEQQIADLEAAKADLQKIIDEQAASIEDLNAKLKEAHDAAVVAASEAPKVTSARARAQKKVSDAWAGVMATLSSTKMNSQIVPYQDTFAAMVNLAGAYAELGVTTLTEYLDRVRKRMGPAAEPLIPQFTDGWNEYQKKIATDDQEQITGKIDPTDNDSIGRAARELHRMVIQRDGLDASADGRNAAVVAVYDIMKDYVEGITEEEVARAMSGIGVYSELNKDEVEVIRRDQKAQLLLLQQLGDWKKGQAPPATGREMPPVSDEQRELRRAVNEAKKDAGIVTTTEGQLRSALDAAKRMAKNRISDLTKAIETGERIAASKKLLKPDAELTALYAERDALQKLYDDAFGKRELSEEQRINAAEKALDRAISDMESDLASGKLYSDPAKPPVTSPAIEAKRAALDALKASRDELRLSSGEAQARSDAAFERHLLERDAELARRLAENDFKPAAKKPERVLTPAMLKAMQAIQKKEEALLKKRKEWEFQNRHIVYKMWKKGPVQAMGMIRKGLTTIDQSLIGRQGWLLGITHPLIYGKAIRKAFASNMREAKSIFPTEQDIFNTEAALDADENWVRLEKIGKLAVTGVHGGLKKTEENYSDVPAWFDNIPGIGGSERAGSAFINSQRRLVFRELVTQLATMQGKGEASLSSADLRVIGNMVNVASGRASLGRLENSIQGATMLFFSPRWWASRLQTLVGAPIYSESRWLGGEGASTDVRLLVAKEWAKQMAAQTAIMTLAVSALAAAFGEPGDDEEWDWYANPSNPNFGRLRIGSTYIDMTSGIGAHVALLGRLVTGKQVDRWETKDIDRWRMFLNYGRTKLAPVPGIVADWMDGQSIGQDPFGSYDWATSKVVPLSIQDVVKTVREEGLPLGAIVSTMMFFGLGAQTREAKTRSRADISNEIRAMRKQGKSPEKIQAALQKHLEYTAKIEAKEKLRTANPDEKAALESVVAGDSQQAMVNAVEKEKYDLTIRALEMLSSEDRTKNKAADEDSSIMTARSILKEIAPTYKEAYDMFNRAYMAKHGPLTIIVGEKGKKRMVTKDGVLAARRRLRAIYAP